jgi:nucleoside-diphosphate-sugar epimerase
MPAIHSGKVCVFGAGGSVGVCVYEALRADYQLRLTDIATVEQIIARPGGGAAPCWKSAPASPHEWRTCDVTDYAQVEAALDGCDAAINLVVNRNDLDTAFQINVVGTYNIMKAAVARQLKRVIHTGVWTRVNGYEGDYRYEYRLTDDVPLRAGTMLYPHTKSLGVDIVNSFAREAGLDVMTFLLSRLRPHDQYDGRDDDVLISFSVAFADLGEAYRLGLRAPVLPQPNERFFICAPLPLNKYLTEKAERLLGWKPRHTFDQFYRREFGIPPVVAPAVPAGRG